MKHNNSKLKFLSSTLIIIGFIFLLCGLFSETPETPQERANREIEEYNDRIISRAIDNGGFTASDMRQTGDYILNRSRSGFKEHEELKGISKKNGFFILSALFFISGFGILYVSHAQNVTSTTKSNN